MCFYSTHPTEAGANTPRKKVGRALLLWSYVRRGVVDDLPFPGFRILRQVEVLLRAAINCYSDGQIAANKQDKAFTSEAAALSFSGMTVSSSNARILRCEKKSTPGGVLLRSLFVSTAWRRRGRCRRSASGAASPHPSPCARRRSTCRRREFPSSSAAAGSGWRWPSCRS